MLKKNRWATSISALKYLYQKQWCNQAAFQVKMEMENTKYNAQDFLIR